MYKADMPCRIGTKTAKNRITMAPTVKFTAGEDGIAGEFFAKHYGLRAKGGVGFICVEATAVSPEGRLFPSQIGLWNDEQISGHKAIADACHEYGTLVVPQLHHGGLGTHPACGPYTSPSPVMWGRGDERTLAHELSVYEIHRIQQNFVDAALRAQKAGYDGVQLHGCHQYLINDFASDINKRTDEYGGSTENRARFGCEIIKPIRKACGKDFIISIRTTGCDPTIEESIAIADRYVAAGADFLQISSGIADTSALPHDDSLPYNRIAELGVKFREYFKGIVPVSCVNDLRSPEQVNYLLENELVDFVDLACGLLADPDFAGAILYGKKYVKCFSCKGCAWGPFHDHICPALKIRGNEDWPW